MCFAVRSVLVFFLAIALIAGGVPFAHAMPVHAMPVHAKVTVAHDASAGAMVHKAHAHGVSHIQHHDSDNEAAADMRRDDVDLNKNADGPCPGSKCCSMCVTACVEPSLRPVSADRMSLAVRYDIVTLAHPQAMIFVDPGIPIA